MAETTYMANLAPDQLPVPEEKQWRAGRDVRSRLQLLTASAPRLLGGLKVDLQWSAVKVSAVQSGNSGASLMPFHLDKAKALALTGKNIRYKFRGTHSAKL